MSAKRETVAASRGLRLSVLHARAGEGARAPTTNWLVPDRIDFLGKATVVVSLIPVYFQPLANTSPVCHVKIHERIRIDFKLTLLLTSLKHKEPENYDHPTPDARRHNQSPVWPARHLRNCSNSRHHKD